MNIRIVPIDQINAAAYNPRVDLQPGDVEYEKLRSSIEERTHWAYGRRSSAIQENWSMTSKGKIILESKKDMKKRGLKSPDRADAYVLTFGEYLLGAP